MSATTISLETLIELIEALSQERQSLLFDKLHERRLERERQQNGDRTAAKTESLEEAGNARLDCFKAAQSGNFWGLIGYLFTHSLYQSKCATAYCLWIRRRQPE